MLLDSQRELAETRREAEVRAAQIIEAARREAEALERAATTVEPTPSPDLAESDEVTAHEPTGTVAVEVPDYRELVRSIVRTGPKPPRRRTVRRDPFATRPATRGERAA